VPAPDAPSPSGADLWPLPVRGAGGRALGVVGWAVEVVLGLLSGGSTAMSPSDGTPAKRLDEIRAGQVVMASAAVLGSSSWCPSIPGSGSLSLTAGQVTYSQGTSRALPVDRLAPVAVRPSRAVSTSIRLPRVWWVLDLDGPAGAGRVAAPLDHLALLGAVAGWPPPHGWPVGHPSQ